MVLCVTVWGLQQKGDGRQGGRWIIILQEDIGVEHEPIDAGDHYLLRGIALFCITSSQGVNSWYYLLLENLIFRMFP